MSDTSTFTVQDDDDFVIFIAEKSKNVTAPFSIEELCSEFKRESGSPHSEWHLRSRLRLIRLQVFDWEDYETHCQLKVFDIDTKVKMLFALGAPVDFKFIEKLKEDAVVEVDEHQRITKYEKNGADGLRLSGVHHSQAPKFPDGVCGTMLKLLAKISQSRSTPMTDEDFLKEYVKSTNTSQTENYADDWYRFLKENIHLATEFDMPTRIKMLFVSGARVNLFFLGMLRKDAIVEVDHNRRITKYEVYDRNLTLNINQNSTEEKKEDENQSISDDMNSKIDDVVEVTPQKNNQKRKIPEVSSASDSESSAKIAKNGSEIPFVHAEDILKLIRSLVLALDSPMVKLRENSKKNLQEFLEKIDKAIEKIRDKNHKVAIDEILPILNTSLQIVIKSAPSASSSSEDCASLQLFLCSLRSILITLSIPTLDDFQKTINENIKELDGQDKMIPIEKIRRSLETVFALTTS